MPKNNLLVQIPLSGLLLFLIAAAIACGSPDPTPWRDIIKGDDPPPPIPTIPTSNHLVVYLDTSGSMAGYVSSDREGQTIFSRSLQELRNFVSLITPPIDVLVRRVDSSISNAYPDSYLSEASLSKSVFNGKETDLAGAVSLFEKGIESPGTAAQANKNSKDSGAEPETPAPPARFHVLVTDGVQSRTKQTADGSCLAGSDQTCVRKRILALLNKGWGGYVIGIRSEFQGKVFSEITRGTSIDYQSRKREPQSLRPFYVYIFSPDRAALDGLVGVFVDRLRPLLASPDGLRTLALTSSYSDGPAHTDFIQGGPLLSESKPGRYQNPPGFTLRVAIETDKKGPVPFQLVTLLPWARNVRDGGTPKELAELVTWTIEPLRAEQEAKRTERARYPEVKIVGQQIAADGKVTLDLTAQYPGGSTGDALWRNYRIEGRLNLGQHTPPWILQWSTNLDTSTESANKTLYLESTLLGLWNNEELKKNPVARIYLRVGR